LRCVCRSQQLGDETRTSNRDRDALVALENEWLKNEHDAAEPEHIQTSDFRHPVVTDDLLTQAQHIEFSSKHLSPSHVTNHFEGLQFVFMAMSVLSMGW
jgi:hypothetical protein